MDYNDPCEALTTTESDKGVCAMPMNDVLAISGLKLQLPEDGRSVGTRTFVGLLELATRGLAALDRQRDEQPLAVVSRMRGTGRGVSLSRLFDQLDRDHPVKLESPFEGSEYVSGAVWHSETITGAPSPMSIAKLRWKAGALDLPMHVHEHSDRFIIVRRGRGYFHVSDEPVDGFTGKRVRTIPARERDVFMFSRGVVHTFSTDREDMELISCQSPFLPFDHPDQYRLPAFRWTAGEFGDPYPVTVACDPGWMVAFHEFGVFSNTR